MADNQKLLIAVVADYSNRGIACSLRHPYNFLTIFHGTHLEDLIDRFTKERFNAASQFASEMKQSLLEINLQFQII